MESTERRPMTQCACLAVERLCGAQASLYACGHLKRMMANRALRALLYRCPDTGTLWRLAYAERCGEDDEVIELTKIDRETAGDEFELC